MAGCNSSMLSLMGMNDHSIMMNPLDVISPNDATFTFALVAIKSTGFPRVKIIGLKRSEILNCMSEERLIRRGVCTNDQDTLQWELKPKVMLEDGDESSAGYGRIHVRRTGDVYMIKIEVHETLCELSFEGDPSLKYYLAFECDKSSIMLMGRRDLTIYLVTGSVLYDRPACPICHSSPSEFEIFSCGHYTCNDCLEKVYRTCKDCPVCKKDWRGGRERVEKGFVYDSFCRLDDCMLFNVLNLPCRCITCDKNSEQCTRCRQTIHSSLPFFKQ